MHDRYLQNIKSFEGFTPKAKWDYAQNTNGYGTKALYPGELIDEAEANTRFAKEIDEARRFVERHAAGWDEGTKAALTSLTFNAGHKWASSGLGDAVRARDIAAVREKFLCYTKAGGVDLPGLVSRRLQEARWIGAAATDSERPPTNDSALPIVRPEASPVPKTSAANLALSTIDNGSLPRQEGGPSTDPRLANHASRPYDLNAKDSLADRVMMLLLELQASSRSLARTASNESTRLEESE